MISRTELKLDSKAAVPVCRLNTVILGAGAAGMNCTVHHHEFLLALGGPRAQERIAVVTAGRKLGVSRMSGWDKQTYYIGEIELTALASAACAISRTTPRPIPRRDEPFERMWTAFREDAL